MPLPILESLEGEILFGQAEPGQELIEDALIARFGAKRHQVRAALQELERQGLVSKPRGRSARVRQLDAGEIDELYRMRALLQREAARLMPLPVPPAQLAELRAIDARHGDAIARGAPPMQIHRLNDTFHETLFALCGNALLCEMIADLNRRAGPIRAHGIAAHQGRPIARAQHAQMIAALAQGDRPALARLLVIHMLPALDFWRRAHAPAPHMAGAERTPTNGSTNGSGDPRIAALIADLGGLPLPQDCTETPPGENAHGAGNI